MSQQPSLSPEDVPRAQNMPVLGLGTWENDDLDQCAESVETALGQGYRHIDTAQAYGNEEAVGRGIENSHVDREDIFLATKVWIDNLSRDDVVDSTQKSLHKLGVDTVDLLYVHWPAGDYDPEDTLGAMERLVEDDAVDRIGVSNFEPHHLERAMEATEGTIFANQVEMHPLLQQEELRSYADAEGIELVAYSPLARGKVMDVEELQDIAAKHDVTPAQVSLAWLREKGVTTIPKATGPEHIRDNFESIALDLDAEDIAAIDDIDREERQVDPSFGPDNW
ncbi:aldo/keto reductase [Halomarina rubra]|uniref:Aldo/keto reductase n=1 Tax=Halomarina rubra TaxID=2071873 RepID=A0ABD6AW16_9EURY|nr:aldo/keto reductase [Halomarina rubra]